jgi:hypothetical protein
VLPHGEADMTKQRSVQKAARRRSAKIDQAIVSELYAEVVSHYQ